VFIVVWAALLIETAFGGCHTGSIDPQWLGVRTSLNTDWAKTNDGLYANIYADGQWKGWKFLDNAGCDDYQLGQWDYFDDFDTVTSKWEVMALYQCGNDGVLVEAIKYWDGSNGDITIGQWDAGVFGPFPEKCSYKNSDADDHIDEAWDLYLDGDGNVNDITGCCHGVVFTLDGSYGEMWTGTRPGIPDCAQSGDSAVPGMPRSRSPPPRALTVNDFEAASSYYFATIQNYLLVAVAVGTLVFVSNVCMFGAMMRGRKRRTFSYLKAGMNSDDGL